ncbi:nuclear pore complex protein NUP50A-like [Rhodamnia argentea]|uniref:Nuclear pore complex protein NUP50A-like n=1 Tax=Rhodamnia argentea TaxID=178133 RepID=A0A8B8NIA4_9MYRT|nr:nuclear pore complex protein NUP50A-like [Rhodamnia argentea]XP_030522225.1 nuclear pore complex protein NUP50A-like [Rhodamnia argentea]XP_048130540.1 nuclear pore complex protein NUP50A-like [Rhodamnia argentea]
MEDAENTLPPSKKRAAGRELNRDRPELDDEEDASEQESGTFKRASNDVLATRRIVKVRRSQGTSAPASNPFAGIRLVPLAEAKPAEVSPEEEVVSEKATAGLNEEDKEIEKDTNGDNKQAESKTGEVGMESAADKDVDGNAKKASEPKPEVKAATGGKETESDVKKDDENSISTSETTPLSSFQQLSSTQNAFTGLAGTGFSTSTFSFGSIPKEGSATGTGSGSVFGLKGDQPSFGFGLSSNGNSSIFGTSVVSKGENSSVTALQEVVFETGEENERVVFSADSVLFEYVEGCWKERGKGEIKVNVSTTGNEKARLLMRTRGNYRLILNAGLYPEMKLTNMDKKGITFVCVNSITEEKDNLSTFALKFKDGSILEEFREAVAKHQGNTAQKDDDAAAVLKTPENSPKASNE